LKMRRLLFPGLLLAGALTLQAAVFNRLAIFDVAPDLILVVVISIALLQGPTAGALCGFGAGMLRDLLLGAPVGLGGLTYLLVGYGIGSVRCGVGGSGVSVSVVGTLVGSLFESALYVVLLALSGQPLAPASRVIQVVLVGSLYNPALALLVHPAVRKVLAPPRREVAYRR
ncbi:MAG: rod shape-determining protein MreD, partial [Actinomycetota bacterium]